MLKYLEKRDKKEEHGNRGGKKKSYFVSKRNKDMKMMEAEDSHQKSGLTFS